MSYRGLGATRPAWCPPTSLRKGQTDPCEIPYEMDLPIFGKQTFRLPIPAMTNDAMNQVQARLPQVLDATLPVAYEKVLPYVNSLKADLVRDIEFLGPRLAQDLMDDVVLPELELQKENIVAQANVLKDEALITAVAVGGMVVIAVGAAAWWIKKG